MTPPLRDKSNQEELWKGLRGNDLQVISTDHCPFCFKEQKELGRDDFSEDSEWRPGGRKPHEPDLRRRRGSKADQP